MPTTVTVKGQVTIPKAVRDRAGIRAGTRVEVINDIEGAVRIVPVVEPDAAERQRRAAEFDARMERARAIYEAQRDPNDSWQNMSTDEYMAHFRDPLEPFELTMAVAKSG